MPTAADGASATSAMRAAESPGSQLCGWAIHLEGVTPQAPRSSRIRRNPRASGGCSEQPGGGGPLRRARSWARTASSSPGRNLTRVASRERDRVACGGAGMRHAQPRTARGGRRLSRLLLCAHHQRRPPLVSIPIVGGLLAGHEAVHRSGTAGDLYEDTSMPSGWLGRPSLPAAVSGRGHTGNGHSDTPDALPSPWRALVERSWLRPRAASEAERDCHARWRGRNRFPVPGVRS